MKKTLIAFMIIFLLSPSFISARGNDYVSTKSELIAYISQDKTIPLDTNRIIIAAIWGSRSKFGFMRKDTNTVIVLTKGIVLNFKSEGNRIRLVGFLLLDSNGLYKSHWSRKIK